jgi:acyl carrier protein
MQAPRRSDRPERPLHASVIVPSELEVLTKKDVFHVVRRILMQRSIDRPIAADDDLREIGLTSLDMVDLVLSVESEFDVSVPEASITPANFRSITTIDALVKSLRG